MLSFPGINLSLRQFEELFGPLEIQTLSYDIREVVVTSPYEAETRYSLRIKAIGGKTGVADIDLANLERTIIWHKVCSNCPATSVRWLIGRDAASACGAKVALEHAKTDRERLFVLMGSERSALEDLIKSLQENGISLLEKESLSEAFSELSLANKITKYIKEEEALSARIDAEVADEKIKNTSSDESGRQRATLFRTAGESYAALRQFDKALNYFAQSLTMSDVKDVETIAKIHKEIAKVHLAGGEPTSATNSFRKGYDLLISLPQSELENVMEDDLTDVLVNLVMLYELEGRDAAAVDLIRDATSRVNNDEFRAFMLYFYGINKWMRGDVHSAVNYSEQALKLFSKTGGDPQERNEALFSMSFMLSMIYTGQGDYKHAAENLRIAREHFIFTDDDEDEAIPEDLIKMVEGVFYAAQGVETVGLARLESLFTLAFKNLPGELSVPDLLDLKGIDYLKRGTEKRDFSVGSRPLSLRQNSTTELFLRDYVAGSQAITARGMNMRNLSNTIMQA
jgi:tetratricopeptide (TPR) repeat protein